ncbi:MAG: hypothetical protein LBD28_05200 [Tannerellaceae bacterium]|jgi:hypothetical protein|nr:hypothetical protein [Tannerellaceae bacterium]
MVSFNCYQEGYNDGFRDAMNGKSKSYTGFPKAKAMIAGHAYDTYVEGYNQGYADGMAKKSGVYR